MHPQNKRYEVDLNNWKLPFFVLWAGQAFSLLGSSLVGFSLVWWMTVETGSATVLATAAMMGAIPMVILGPLAGVLVDRWNRRIVLIFADGIIALATAVLLYLSWRDLMQPWHIYALMLIRASGGAFHLPAMQASTSLMVPDDQLTRVQGLNQMLTGAMNVVAPPLGALLLEWMPLGGVLAIDITTAMLAIAPLFFLKIPQPSPLGGAASGDNYVFSVWRDMRAGFKYVWNWSALKYILFIAIGINLVSTPAASLMPLLVTRRFSGTAIDLASVQSSWAVGFLVGGILLAVWGGFQRKLLTSTVGMFGQAAGMLLVGFAPAGTFRLVLFGWFLAGLMNVLLNGPAFALLQSVVEPSMQGRVFTLVISLAGMMAPLGLALAGPLADNMGVEVWFIIAGVTSLVGGANLLLNSTIKQIETSRLGDAERRGANPISESMSAEEGLTSLI